MRRKFQTLRFTPGKSRGRLPQPQIAQSDLVEDLQLRGAPGRARGTRQGLAHREMKHLVDVPVAIAHFEHAALEARSTALLTDKFHISQELHLDGDRAVALARLTPPAGDVERESPRVIAALSGLRSRGKDFADRVEGFQVSSGVQHPRSEEHTSKLQSR